MLNFNMGLYRILIKRKPFSISLIDYPTLFSFRGRGQAVKRGESKETRRSITLNIEHMLIDKSEFGLINLKYLILIVKVVFYSLFLRLLS